MNNNDKTRATQDSEQIRLENQINSLTHLINKYRDNPTEEEKNYPQTLQTKQQTTQTQLNNLNK